MILTIAVVGTWAAPAAAAKPDFWKGYSPPIHYPVADCAPYGYDFWVWNAWEQWETFHFKYNSDGTLNYMFQNLTMSHTFTAVPDTGKSVSAMTHDTLIWRDMNTDIFEFRGTFQKIIIPGVGPIFQDSGRKIFHGTWLPDGTLTFDLIFNAGPSSYTSNDFSALCAYLAP